jgi:hypothetical protein
MVNALAQLWNEIPTEHLLKPKALADPDGHGVIFAAGVGEVPEEMPLLLGEQLYQLRSALDACIYQATIYATKQDPPPDERQIRIPNHIRPYRMAEYREKEISCATH